MSKCIIVWRNPTNGRIGFISEDDDSGELAVFLDEDAAKTCAREHPLLSHVSYQIVELELA